MNVIPPALNQQGVIGETMSAFTAIPSNYMLDWYVGKTSAPAAATRYITTFSGDPNGAGVENINTLTGSPTRTALTPGFGSGASASSTANTSIITFFTSASGTGTVDHLAIFDSATGGNQWGSCTITSKLNRRWRWSGHQYWPMHVQHFVGDLW